MTLNAASNGPTKRAGGPGAQDSVVHAAELFRREVTVRRADRLAGDVAIAVPVSWQIIGWLLLCGVLIAAAFLCFGSYSRVEIVTGTIVPDSGDASIVPTRAGVITAISVHDGDEVIAGAELVLVRSEEANATGKWAGAPVESAIAAEDANLRAQIEATQIAGEAQQRQLTEQQAGLTAEIGQIRNQIALQRELIASANLDLEAARKVAEHGYISRRDLQVREETLLVRQQNLSQLTQSLAVKQSALAESGRNAAQLQAQSKAQHANLNASRAEVAQQAATLSGARSYILRAPVAGRVTAVTARIGQPANTQTPVLTIVPAGSVLRAELSVPSSAIGFVKPGQDVRIAIDAFPYQRFGTLRGRILTVSHSAIRQQGTGTTVTTVYPVTVELERSTISAYGHLEPLISGMTLTARIVTARQSLWQWLFEPLLAVQRR